MWSCTHAPFENVFGVLRDIWSHTHILYGIMPTYWDCVVVGNKSLHGIKKSAMPAYGSL